MPEIFENGILAIHGVGLVSAMRLCGSDAQEFQNCNVLKPARDRRGYPELPGLYNYVCRYIALVRLRAGNVADWPFVSPGTFGVSDCNCGEDMTVT